MSLDAKNSDKSIIGELCGHVAAQSKNGILHCLFRIRNDGKIFDRFVKENGIDVLIKLLKQQNAKILDTTLSILADAFLKSNVRNEVRPTRIACNVVWIIKNLTSGISLHCRACRLIGNMAESIVHAKALCDAGVIPALGDILNSKTNTQTLIMAVRAVRNIWSTYEPSQNEILESGLIKDITVLLVSFKSKFQDDSTLFKYKDSADTCLKALRAFADTLDSRSGKQMRIKSDLRGYKCIVECCNSNNRMSFQILYKLCRIADHRPSLGSAGAIECIVQFLESKLAGNTNPSFSREVVMSICLFSREAVNRLRLRDAGGLEVMLKLLADVQNETYHAMLLHALTQFVYDEESIAIMIRNGIVNVLVNRLKRMVLDNRLEAGDARKIDPTSRKRTAENMSPPTYVTIANQMKHNRASSGRYSLDLHTSDWSPCSVSSACSSPSNSSPMSYYTIDGANDEDDNYSPVCSDDEDRLDEDSTTLHEEADSLNSYVSTNIGREDDGGMDNDEESSKNDSMMELSEVNLPHMWTLILLTKLTLSNDPIEGLAHPTTIRALTAYIETSKNFRAPSILNRIIKNHVYFLPLLLQGFVFEAQLLKNAHDYLRNLCNIAESGGAFGELAAILLRGQESHKLMVAVSVPFLLRSKEKLRQLLNDYGGLDLIFSLLVDEKHLLNENSVLSVCQLANALGIVPETLERRTFSSDSLRENDSSLSHYGEKNNVEDGVQPRGIVTFELDDGGTVDVCRRLLCIKSEVFCAMLEGRFFEAGLNRIRLPSVSREGFAVLCLTASGRSFDDRDNDDYDLKIEALLDAVLLADKFLMIDESEKLTETSISRLTHENLNRAWSWARLNDCREFQTCCVKNFLTSKLSRNDRLGTFRNFAANQNFKEFLDDVKDIVTSELSMRN